MIKRTSGTWMASSCPKLVVGPHMDSTPRRLRIGYPSRLRIGYPSENGLCSDYLYVWVGLSEANEILAAWQGWPVTDAQIRLAVAALLAEEQEGAGR